MSEFAGRLSSTLKPSLSFIDRVFAEFNESAIDNASLGYIGIPNVDSLLPYNQPGFNIPYADNFSRFPPAEFPKMVGEPEISNKSKAEVAVEDTEASSAISSRREDKSMRKKNRGKPKKMVHVRARRGQATDSHSLAERVRRERINEKMRCLQDLVPGCYKTMGMAAMLDEIINYVQSLQNQVEFLSLKLSVASSFNDFNLDLEAMVAPQQEGYVQIAETPSSDYRSFMSTIPFGPPR